MIGLVILQYCGVTHGWVLFKIEASYAPCHHIFIHSAKSALGDLQTMYPSFPTNSMRHSTDTNYCQGLGCVLEQLMLKVSWNDNFVIQWPSNHGILLGVFVLDVEALFWTGCVVRWKSLCMNLQNGLTASFKNCCSKFWQPNNWRQLFFCWISSFIGKPPFLYCHGPVAKCNIYFSSSDISLG